MTFQRSSSGLANQPVFYDSAVVVYVEGGVVRRPSLELTDGEPRSQDALFWAQVIESVCGPIAVHFKELGSKGALLEFASGLDQKALGRVLVCIDRDYDDFQENLVNINCLVRTYSYSWESDVWARVVLVSVVEQMLPVGRLPPAALQHCVEIWVAFYARIARFIALDVKLIRGQVGVSLFRRDSPAAAVRVERDAPPSLNCDYFARQISVVRPLVGRPWRLNLINAVNPERHTYGKAAMVFGYQLCGYMLRYCGVTSQFSSEALTNLAIRAFGRVLNSPEMRDFQSYYAQQLRVAGVLV